MLYYLTEAASEMIRLILLSILAGLMASGCHREQDSGLTLTLTEIEALKQGKLIQVSSFDTTGGNNDRINIPAGQTAVIFNEKGPGVIARIWITIDSRDPYFLRRILLRFYWDDETEPSVEVPVGDFFGCGFEYRHHSSEFTGMTSGGYFCYFPMPFAKNGRIEVVNETSSEIYAFYYQVEYYRRAIPVPAGTPYFHAYWNRNIRTRSDSNYTILLGEGKGFLAGVSMNMQSYNGSLGYLEGDEMVFVDGEKEPSIYGTGTEDYFNSGWYFNHGEFSAPYHGLVLKDEETGRISAYRYHIPDPIPFSRSILFTIEHGHANESEADYSSIAFWYQLEPHRPFSAMLPANARIPLRQVIPTGCLEAENLETDPPGIGQVTDMLEHGPEWSGGKQLTIDQDTHPHFDILVPGLREAQYLAEIYYTRGPGYGNAGIYSAGSKLGMIRGSSDEILPAVIFSKEKVRTEKGTLRLSFKSAESYPKPGRNYLGLDAIKLVPVRNYIPSWQVIGPFPSRRESDILRFGLDSIFGPEKHTDLSASYPGIDSRMVRWKEYETPEGGYFNLLDKVDPFEFAVTYALTFIYSPYDQVVPLLFGSDDGIKVFLNGSEIFRYLGVRIASADQDEIGLPLREGWNELLLKVENNFGGYAFYARVLDQEGSLMFSSRTPTR